MSSAVRSWALAHGDDPRYRIVLCGYEAEHAAAMPETWRTIVYKASVAYQTAARTGNTTDGNQANRRQERLWLSPHCLTAGRQEVLAL